MIESATEDLDLEIVKCEDGEKLLEALGIRAGREDCPRHLN
jgi:hypothetical protein